jgi:hypothetical protein
VYTSLKAFTAHDGSSRLAPPALEALRDIKDGAAEMGKNFDGKHDEPKFLPVRFPNLIVTLHRARSTSSNRQRKSYGLPPQIVLKVKAIRYSGLSPAMNLSGFTRQCHRRVQAAASTHGAMISRSFNKGK